MGGAKYRDMQREHKCLQCDLSRRAMEAEHFCLGFAFMQPYHHYVEW